MSNDNGMIVTLEEYDKLGGRKPFGRWLVLIGTVVCAIIIPWFIINWIGSQFFDFPGDFWLYGILALIVGGEFMANVASQFLVQVPQVQGFVTLNPFKKTADPNVIYGPGLHVSYPWEERSEKSNFSSEIITLDWAEEVPGKDTQLVTTGSYQFKVNLGLANRFVGVDATTIKAGIIDLIKADVSQELSDKSADEAKGQIGALNKKLEEKFGRNSQNAFEQQYGIDTVRLVITGIDLPPKVQASRDAKDQSSQVFAGVAAMLNLTSDELSNKLKNGEMSDTSYREYVDRFLIKSENGSLNVQVYDIPDLKSALGSAANFFQSGSK